MPDIPVWNKCNNKCLMCANTAGFYRNVSGDYALLKQAYRLEKYLRGAGAYRKNSLTAGAWNLTGGEPTLNPDFIKAINYFRRRLEGEELTLLSNGRLFSDPVFAAAFAEAARPPFILAVSLHGPSAAVHDKVAGVKGAFKETLLGIKNLLALPAAPFLELRVILHKRNYRGLAATLAFIKRLMKDRRYRVVVLHYEIEGSGEENRKKLEIRLSATARQVNACARALAGFGEARLYHFPRCLLKPSLRRLAMVSLPPEDRAYPQACAACRDREVCVGLMKPYLLRYGAGELKTLPVKD